MKYIYLSGDIAPAGWGNISAESVRGQIASARADDPAEPVTAILNSYGGDVSEGIAIYNLLRAAQPLDIIVSGMAASIASVVAMAGGHVAMYDNSTLFVHHAWSGAIGNAADFEQLAEELKAADRTLISAYVRKSGRTEEEIVALLDGPNGDGSSIDAFRALELGLIDEILDPATAVAACLSRVRAHQAASAADSPHTAHTSYSPSNNKPQNKETPPMAAEPEIKSAPAAECGGDPAKNEEKVVEIEKEVEETGNDDDRIVELEKKVESLTDRCAELEKELKAKQAKLDSQAHFRAVVNSATQTAAQATKSWPDLVKDLGFKAAAEKFPEERRAYMSAQIARGSIR